MSLWAVPFQKRYLCPVPPDPITFPRTLEVPIPDLTIELSPLPVVPRENQPTYYIIRPSPGRDPLSLTFERTVLDPSRYIIQSQHIVVVKKDPANRCQMEVTSQHFTTFVLPQNYPNFVPLHSPTTNGIRDIRRPQESCALGLSVRGNMDLDLCLRTITTDTGCGTPSGKHVERGVTTAGDPITATMTMIRRDTRPSADIALCFSTGRMAFRGQDVYINNYLTWDSAPA